MNPRTMRRSCAGAVAAAVLLVASGCSTTMRDVPVPGTGVSGETMELKAEFDEALNLAAGAPVKVNGVDSGKVTSIKVDDFTAQVTMDVQTAAELRDGATARLRYTTPLGELFIDVTNPTSGKPLDDGATLELPETDTAPTVEDALSQASLLINGGGLAQLQTITEELNTVLGGNEENIRGMLQRANTFMREANATTGSIDQVLTSLNSLSGTLTEREDLINRAVRDIRPAAAVLRRATPEFTRLLNEVRQFSGAANNVVNATRTQLINLLGEVEPVLAELASNRGRFNDSLRAIEAGADAARQAIPTEYLNISLDLQVDGIQGLGGGGGLTGGIEDLLDVLNDGLLGGLTGRTTDRGTTDAPTGNGGGTGDPGDDPLGLGEIVGPLTGGGA